MPSTPGLMVAVKSYHLYCKTQASNRCQILKPKDSFFWFSIVKVHLQTGVCSVKKKTKQTKSRVEGVSVRFNDTAGGGAGMWQFVMWCLQAGQLWTPWDSLDESILHFYSQEKGEDNCSVLMAASNCSERWRIVMKPGVNNHLGGDKSPDKDPLFSTVFIFQ